MRGPTILIASLLVSGCAQEEGSSAERNAAVLRVVDEVLTPAGLGEDDVVIYGPEDQLKTGDRVMPVRSVDGTEPTVATMDGPTWFLWIDLAPFANFSHPTQFVYVDAASGELLVENQEWYAVVNGRELLPGEGDEPLRVFGDPVYPPAMMEVPTSQNLAGERLTSSAVPSVPMLNTDDLPTAALVANGWPGSRNTLADFDNMSKVFMDRNYALTTVVPHAEDPAATRADILAALDALGGERETPLKQFVFYYTGHGEDLNLVMGADTNSSHVLGVLELAEKIAAIDALEVVLILDACKSGSFVDRFRLFFTESIKATDRTVAVYSASTSTQSSWTDIFGGGTYTNQLLEKINMHPTGQMLPLVTDGNLFQVVEQGSREVLGFIGRDTVQTPQWDYICPCSPRGLTKPMRFNGSFENGNTNCGRPASTVSLVILDWYDGELTARSGEIDPLLTGGTMASDGRALIDTASGAIRERYDAFVFCDCGGAGSYSFTDSLDCVTTWDLTLTKQPW